MSNDPPAIKRKPPRGLMRHLSRMPLWFYRFRLGWLLGSRFLMMTHIGRKSGLPRYVVLEVVQHDPATNTRVIGSGMGEQADWYRNIQHNPHVLIDNGKERYEAIASRLPEDEGIAIIRAFAQRSPWFFQRMCKTLLGRTLEDTEEEYRVFVRALPMVALTPKASAAAAEHD